MLGGQQLDGKQYLTTLDNWRRIAHIISDAIYERLTGDGGYFDSRVELEQIFNTRGTDPDIVTRLLGHLNIEQPRRANVSIDELSINTRPFGTAVT
jgi:hypothetical protein